MLDLSIVDTQHTEGETAMTVTDPGLSGPAHTFEWRMPSVLNRHLEEAGLTVMPRYRVRQHMHKELFGAQHVIVRIICHTIGWLNFNRMVRVFALEYTIPAAATIAMAMFVSAFFIGGWGYLLTIPMAANAIGLVIGFKTEGATLQFWTFSTPNEVYADQEVPAPNARSQRAIERAAAIPEVSVLIAHTERDPIVFAVRRIGPLLFHAPIAAYETGDPDLEALF